MTAARGAYTRPKSLEEHAMTIAASGPRPRPGIMDIAAYVPGGSKAPGAMTVHKLSSNESALGCSPQAVAAFVETSGTLHRYPDGTATGLREKIAKLHGLDWTRIVCGAGSDELLQLLVRGYAGPGDNIVQSDHGFLVYAIAAKGAGATPRFAPEKNLVADVDAMLRLVDGDTRIVFLANPNNPTGTYLPDSEVRRLHAGLPRDVLLVVDSAYAEYMEEKDYADGAALVDEFDNVVMTRTFSKIYGLAALRLGWAYCPKGVADVLNRIRGPFNVTTTALAAGEAALGDQAFVARNRAHNRTERDYLCQQFARLKLDYVKSFGNFLLADLKTPERASAVQTALKKEGVIVREVGAYKLGRYLRIT
ncbi:MAG: histidinol-phosphate transaminase, partial [Parvularculaceae bacterium]|nr:histidinol-phosphate transaminase [Parvularculaceae bacterium]